MEIIFRVVRSLFATAPLLLIGPLAGCSANVAATPEPADAEASALTAVVVVERTVGYAGADSARSEAVARFVRVRGGTVDEDALRMVGAAVDFPPLGACARVTAQRAAFADRAIEL